MAILLEKIVLVIQDISSPEVEHWEREDKENKTRNENTVTSHQQHF
jgi:hypothetical protein